MLRFYPSIERLTYFFEEASSDCGVILSRKIKIKKKTKNLDLPRIESIEAPSFFLMLTKSIPCISTKHFFREIFSSILGVKGNELSAQIFPLNENKIFVDGLSLLENFLIEKNEVVEKLSRQTLEELDRVTMSDFSQPLSLDDWCSIDDEARKEITLYSIARKFQIIVLPATYLSYLSSRNDIMNWLNDIPCFIFVTVAPSDKKLLESHDKFSGFLVPTSEGGVLTFTDINSALQNWDFVLKALSSGEKSLLSRTREILAIDEGEDDDDELSE
jgi:hypothetical protein